MTIQYLRELFLQRLPSNVRMVLAPSADSITLDNLAEMADRVMEVSSPTIGAVHTPTSSADIESLRSEVRQLTDLVQSLTFRSRDRPLPTVTRPAQPVVIVRMTTLHQQFGDAATKCHPPCRLNDQASR